MNFAASAFLNKCLATDPATVMQDVQEFLGVDLFFSKEKFVPDPETGFFCFQKAANADPVCLPEDKVRYYSSLARGSSSLDFFSQIL